MISQVIFCTCSFSKLFILHFSVEIESGVFNIKEVIEKLKKITKKLWIVVDDSHSIPDVPEENNFQFL